VKNSLFSIILTLLTLALTFAGSVDKAYAKGPMPYTDEAVRKLNAAIAASNSPTDVNGDGDTRVKTYINRHREIFAAAGYDYERSMIKIINDIQFDRYVLNKATITLNSLARELLRLHVRTGVNPKKYLNRDCAELLIEFRDLIRSNMQKYGSC
jgi:hypothetical protein